MINLLALILVVPAVALGMMLGQFLVQFRFQHQRLKCGECGKKVKAPQVLMTGPPCQDCIEKMRQRNAAENQAMGIPLGSGGLGPSFTEDMIKTYSDPRLRKVLRETFRPQTEAERFASEANSEEE
jgi:hypothetical protein